jgi:protoporphyrinogen oxidase
MKHIHTLIIGAGPSGLALAYGLQGDTLVLERESGVGGLCRSINHGGGVFDVGGHSFHTPHPEVYELVQKLLEPEGGLDFQQRDARVYSHGVLIPYPFQKFYDQIPDTDVVQACEEGLRNRLGNAGEADNYEDYIIRNFGQGIADYFMLPYNRKLWACDLKQMSIEWTSERVAAPKGNNEKFDTKGGERKPLQPDTVVGYARNGGFEKIYEAFVPHLPALQLNTSVVHIDPKAKVVTTSTGEKIRYEVLVSSMALPLLARMVEGTDADIISTADALPYMRLRVELLLVGRQLDTTIQRIYCADPAIPSHKMAFNHNSSDYLRALPVHAIMCEVSISDNKQVDVDEIAPKQIDFFTQIGVLKGPQDIVWQGHVDVNYAYPVYTHARPGMVKKIKQYYDQYDIHTIGRFGDWEYINSDKCVMKGLNLARTLSERYGVGVKQV